MRSDVAKFRIVRKSQFTKETVIAYAKLPCAVGDRARHRSVWRREAAGEDAHLLFPSIYDLSRVHTQGVCGVRTRYPIDDDLVLACRGTDEAN